MRKLLIVDDEKNIRLGLASILSRQFPRQYSFLHASNGEEALSLVRREQPDMIITDIRMPGMDGLALIRSIRECGSTAAIIILSGYDDFAYAKAAIPYQIKEYLLKPIVREELFRAMERSEAELQRDQQVQDKLAHIREDRQQMRCLQLLRLLGEEELDELAAAKLQQELGLPPHSSGYAVCILKLPGERIKEHQALEILAQLRDSEQPAYVVDADGHLTFPVQGHQEALRLKSALEAAVYPDFIIGVSEQIFRIQAFKEGYKQAKAAIKYSLLQEPACPALFYYDHIKNHTRAYSIPLEAIRRLFNMLGTGRDHEISSLWHELLYTGRKPDYDIAYLEEISTQVNRIVFDQAFLEFGNAAEDVLKQYKQSENLYRFRTLYEYYQQTLRLMLRLSEYIQQMRSVHREDQPQPEMEKAVKFIHEHFNKNLNMAIVSNHISLNYTYFSQAFKEYTGESFVMYLKKVRIAEAKRLLENSRLKVYEISARVGFEQVKQFHRVFRELEGISAEEYRSKYAVRQQMHP
ncbi:DNA-binding response regulator [Paenibacillus sp. CAA11]|uniref:response regulator n=1 Tax=Paenibacillus sp. CAA11 TaxID=1532905 RepID=UPI000D3C7D85|nr:response regulator [Paenibacillus sp. CAA11]AWB43196.1 DNA-binding response regulator [Paenibacillus sp. CAA11]